MTSKLLAACMIAGVIVACSSPVFAADLPRIGKFDFISCLAGKQNEITHGPTHIVGEPIFVPRSADAAEDDGWLLSLVYSASQHRSRLVVLDARDVESEPVAVAHLRHHVPLGFHGTFTQRVAA